jgi:hypothetical protein
MARLWDAIRMSALNGGAVVTLGSAVPIETNAVGIAAPGSFRAAAS